ncbi:hypothetical protein [Streptomyces sp. NPDC088674]|uniref:hypothetical protein n=1 Tax=Streptomyces sp. NPDC088674 TaxID=3365869 RepID=UPI00380C82AA
MLTVVYEVADLEPDLFVEIRETRGKVTLRLNRNASLDQIAEALNLSVGELLDGGQWFQLWKGEIVSTDSPDDPRHGGTVARIHRGPMVHEAS